MFGGAGGGGGGGVIAQKFGADSRTVLSALNAVWQKKGELTPILIDSDAMGYFLSLAPTVPLTCIAAVPPPALLSLCNGIYRRESLGINRCHRQTIDNPCAIIKCFK